MDSKKVKGGFNMESQKSETITIRKDTLWKYSTFILLGVVILGVAFYVLPGNSPTGAVVQQPGQVLPSEPTAKIEVEIDGAPVKGEGNAPVTFVEFTDYECPFCQRHFMQTGSAIDARIQAGEVKLVTMDYPLPFHTQAQKASEAAHCARDQGGDSAYYEMHDLLFESGVAGGETAFKEYANQMNLDSADFASCLSSGKFADEVQSNMNYGAQIGIQGTPGFFINGRIISGACPVQTFESAIDAELDGDDWAVTNCQFVKL
ncbi:MAG: thioredoxin domain-containing protein [Nanoarchaeota archaeon]